MIKKMKKIISLCFVLFLCGCGTNNGATVNTDLTINDDMSGARMMQVVVDRDVVESTSGLSMNDIHVLVQDYAPEYFTITYNDASSTFDILLGFGSLEEYISKVEYITQEDESVLFLAGDSEFSDGLFIEESFTSIDLLEWMKVLLVEEGYISSSKIDNIFILGDTTFTYVEDTYEVSQPIFMDSMEYVAIDSFSIYTDIHGYNCFSRKVIITFDNEQFKQKESEIEAYFQEILPSEIERAWYQDEEQTIFSFVIEKVSLEYLNTITAIFFNNNESSLEVEQSQDDLFINTHEYLDNLSFSNFTSKDDTPLQYWIRIDETYKTNEDYVQEDDYYLVYDGNIKQSIEQYSFTYLEVAYVESIDIQLESNGDAFTRTTSIALDTLLEHENIAGNYYTIDFQTIDDRTEVIIYQYGSLEDINDSSVELFGNEQDFLYSKTQNIFSFINTITIEDSFDFSDFIQFCSDDFKVTYSTSVGTFSKSDDNSIVLIDNQYIEEFNELQGEIYYSGTYINTVTILCYGIVITGIVCISIIYLKKKREA